MATHFEKVLSQILTEHDDALAKLGEKIRQEKVVPFCNKHGLRFRSGNGTWFFYHPKDTAYDAGFREPEDAKRMGYGNGAESVFKALSLDVGDRMNCIASWVGDVDPE